jgi:hypothetical protein
LAIGVAVSVALDIPNKEAIGLAQATAQAPPGLQTAKNSGIIELTLPVMVVHMDFKFFMSDSGFELSLFQKTKIVA